MFNMKQLIIFLILIPFSTLTISAKNSKLKKQLIELNQNWEQVNIGVLDNDYNYSNEVDLIKLHLSLVEDELRRNTPSNLSAIQKQNRIKCLDILNKYWNNGVFPKNTFHKERRPYFIDIYGTYCAVGYLIKETGFDDVAQKIHQENNYSYIKDLKKTYNEINTWAKQFGFTTDELAWIQPSYNNNYYPYMCIANNPTNQAVIINEGCDSSLATLGGIILPSIHPITTFPVVSAFIYMPFPPFNGVVNCNQLVAGCYDFMLIDSANNVSTNTYCVGFDSTLYATVLHENEQCFGSCNGTIFIDTILNQGVGPFMYNLVSSSSNSFQLNGNFTNLCSGVYNLTISNYFGCSFDTVISLTSPQQLVSQSSIIQSDNGTNNGIVKIIVTGGIAPFNFAWSNGNNTDSISGLASGWYTCLMTDMNGCTKLDSVFVPLMYPQDINELQTQWITISPNPSKGIFSINLDENKNRVHVKLFDLLGKTILSKEFQNIANIQLDLNDYSNGIYLLELDMDNSVLNYKLMKK